ncbi:MAG: PIN domain-containing protein [Planctomycetota bacterium]|nr:PIN domain-containing protein [Planctomycetota bacterium]
MFLDANVLYAAAYREGSPLRRLWQLPDVELWASDYAVAEALGNLSEDRPERSEELRRLVSLLRMTAHEQGEAALPEGVSIADKDRPILAAAIRAQARYLLTGDKAHFGPYFGQVVGGVCILTPGQFLATKR